MSTFPRLTTATTMAKARTLFIFATIAIVTLSMNQVAHAMPVKTNTEAMMYLSQFGWLDRSAMKPGSGALVDIRGAIKDFQSFAGLNVTGDLDAETAELMGTPRCGVRDKIGHDAKRRKRYTLQGSRWKVRDLTYKVTKYPRNLPKPDVDREIEEAFKVWERETNLTFSRVKDSSSKVHIEIRFERGEHGDGDPFDGEGQTLAHAFFPVYGGDAHFDDEEKWSVNSHRGTNLFQVASHEFGHSLGLSHSDVRSALMAPFYRGYQPQFKLDEDDILAIQSLYGKKQAPPVRTRPPTPKPVQPELPSRGGAAPARSLLCDDPKIDTIQTMSDGKTYVFKDDKYYQLTDTSVADGYPRKISEFAPGLPSNLDASFTWTNGRSYFFKGSQYWRFTDMKLDSDYPQDISDGFEGIPSNLDAAMVWSGNGKIYFFKGDKYWRFDPARKPPVSPGYPKPISNWEGIPNNLDAALRYANGYTYFFKGNKYWRFNDRNFAIDVSDPPFPRSVGNWWYGCDAKGISSMRHPDPYGDSDSEKKATLPDYLADSSDETGNRSGCVSHVLLISSHFNNLILWTLVLSSPLLTRLITLNS